MARESIGELSTTCPVYRDFRTTLPVLLLLGLLGPRSLDGVNRARMPYPSYITCVLSAYATYVAEICTYYSTMQVPLSSSIITLASLELPC